MNLILRLILMVVAMSSVVYLIYKLNTVGIDPAIFHIDNAATSSFDTKEVTHFEWKSTHKIFSFDRDRYDKWLPKQNAPKVESLIKFLSQIQLNEVSQVGKTSLDVVLDVSGERWTGGWEGLSFVWNSGPKKGLGQILNEQQNVVFFKGAHVFENYEINFCKNRIRKITLQAHGKNFVIEQIARGWEVTKPAPQTLDPVFIEKWLIGLCKVRVKTLLDLSYAQSGTKQGAVTFEFVNDEKINLSHVERDFFVINNLGMLLENLNTLLDDLKKQLAPQPNP